MSLGNQLWRLTSGELYKIKTADGQGLIPFKPRPEQVELLQRLIDATNGAGPRQLVELKARRPGFSTTIGVFIADCLGFRRDFTAQLVDQTEGDAAKKMNGIVKVALKALLDAGWPIIAIKENDGELSVDARAEHEGSGMSTFFAGTKARGGSVDFLWLSEFGVIQFDDAKRAEEIVTGALPSARHGVKVVETTWKGGKGGKLWDIIEPTLKGVADDWKLSFCPWWRDPRNVSTASMDEVAVKYFAEIAGRLEREGIVLSDGQRRWWAQERRTLGIFMPRENPTFLDECWTAPIEGAVYARVIDEARAQGRVCSMPVDGSNLVNTSWDLGSPANTVVWYWQIVGREIRMIDCDRGDLGTLTERVASMLSRGYNLGKHYLPHDAQQTERSGTTMAVELVKAGLPATSVVTVPRTHSVWIGINHALELFPALAFRSPQCDVALDVLGCYRTRREGEGARQTDEPIHDFASHTADAFRTMAEAHRAGMVAFKHTTAEARPDWYGRERRVRRGAKPMRLQ